MEEALIEPARGGKCNAPAHRVVSRQNVVRGMISKSAPPSAGSSSFFLFLFEAATQLARQVHQERTQIVCSNKVDRSRLALPLLVLF